MAISISLMTGCGGSDSPDGPKHVNSCTPEALTKIKLSDAYINTIQSVSEDHFTTSTGVEINEIPPFCQITASSTPTFDSLINFEIWIPTEEHWNGKLVATGNGGYSPALNYNDMAYAMRQGYAVVGGDTGHQSKNPNEMYWGVGHPEKIRDWGERSVHVITASSKQIISEITQNSIDRSYFYGCSTGGHQAYASMQNYPDDFDGIIAGAPGNNRTRLNVEFLHRFISNRPFGDDEKILITPDKASLITEAANKACDALDGVIDGVVDDPRLCDSSIFDIKQLQCTGEDADDCLTADQIDAALKIYAGPKNPRTGEQLYPGWPVGSEAGWPAYWGNEAPVRADYWRLWVFENPTWDWWNFDFDLDVAFADAKMNPLVDQIDTDLSAFKNSGGKAIVYQGWVDPVVSSFDTIAYYEQVRDAQGSQEEVDQFFRLFMVPGMGHCSGGVGATNFGNPRSPALKVDPQHDILQALDRWVEHGIAPDQIIASKMIEGKAAQTRPLCPYPQVAVHDGTGDINDASSFQCQ